MSTVRQATTSSSERSRDEIEMGAIKPPKQNGGKAAKSMMKNVHVTVSPHSDHANGNASVDVNHKLGKRKHQDVPPSLEDEAPSQAKKARNHVSKTVLLDTTGPAPKKVQKPVHRRKKPRSVIPRALRKKPNNTVKSHSQSIAKSSPSPDTSPADDRKGSIESSAHQCHSKDIPVTENVAKSRTIRSSGASSEVYMLTNPNPHKVRGISPEIPLQSDSSHTCSLTGTTGYVSSDAESNPNVYKPSSRTPPPYDSESSQTDELSESYSEDDWKPARLKKKKAMRHKTMKAAGLIIDDILKIRKQSSRTVLYDCIGSPKGKKGAHSPKRRLSLITRDTPKSERWAGPSTRKPLAIAAGFLGSPGTVQARSERMEKASTTLTQVNLGGGNEKPLIRKTALPSTDSSTDEQDSGTGGEMSKDSGSEKISKVTWLKKLPKRQLTVQLHKEIRIGGKHPKPLSELKSSEAGPVEDRVKQKTLSQQSDEPLVDPLVFATLNSDKDKDEHSSNKTKISSKQNTIPSSDEDLEDAIVDVLGIDSVDEDNTSGARANLKQNFTRIRLTGADFTTGDSPFPGLEDGTSMSSEDEAEESSKQQNGRLSDDDMQEPIDVLGIDDTTSDTELEGSGESGKAKALNLAQKPKPTTIKLTDADLTVEGSPLQGGWRNGAVENIEDGSVGGHGRTKEHGERRKSKQTPKTLTGKAICDIMAAASSGQRSVGTVMSKGDGSKKRKPRSKRALTKKRRFIAQSSLHNVRVVLDALPVCRSPIGKAAVIVNSKKSKIRNKKGAKKKLKAGATSDVKGRSFAGVEGKVAKRAKTGQDSKPPKRKKVAKQMEDDSDDIVVKDLVEADNEDYRVKLKLVSKQKPPEKKVSSKPTRFKPLSGPMGIASSAEDDDTANYNKKGRKMRTTKHTSKLKATDKKLTTKKVVKEDEGSGMEVDAIQAVISEGSVSEKAMQTEGDIMTSLSQNHLRKTVGETSSESTVASPTTLQPHGLEECSYSKTDPIISSLSPNQEEHHSKTVREASSDAVVTNSITHQSRSLEEHNYSKTAPVVQPRNQKEYHSKTVREASSDAVMTSPITHQSRSLEEHNYSKIDCTVVQPQNQEEHCSKTICETSSDAVVTSPITHQSCSLEEHNYSKIDCAVVQSQNQEEHRSKTICETSSDAVVTSPITHQSHSLEEHDNSKTIVVQSQNQEEHHSKTMHEASSNAVVTSPITHQSHSLEEHSYSKTTPTHTAASLTQNLDEHNDKAVDEVNFKSAVANRTTDVPQNRTEHQSKANPTTVCTSLSQNVQSKTIGEASSQSTGTDSTTDQPRSVEEHSDRSSATAVMSGLSQSHESKTASSESTMAHPTSALLSQNHKDQHSKTNPSASSLAQNLEECHSKTVGEISSKSTAATTNSTTQVSQNQARSKSTVANPTTATLLSQNLTDIHKKTLGISTCTTATVSGSNSRNTTGDSSTVVGGASVTMTSSRSTLSTTEESRESTQQPKKRRTTLLNRTKASSGFQLSVVEEKKVCR